MKRIASFAAGLFILAGLAVAPACTEDTPEPTTTPDGGGDAGTTGPLGEPAVPCADSQDAIYGDPGALSGDKGAILKCSKAGEVTKDAVQARLSALKYAGKPATSGARVYRVSYRTERGDDKNTPAVSSAIVFVPTTQRADKLPIIVYGRGTRGQAAKCVVSKEDPATNDDLARWAFPLVGNGFAVIIPDLAGYANFGAANNPPSAYAQAADVGKSTLDGSRALKKLYPQLDDKTVLVGHSQGGHNVLSALALGDTYGAQGSIVGVVGYAPLWLSQRSWGAILEPGVAEGPPGYPIASAGLPSAVSVWYHYTQAELLDGPGEGKKLFKADKQDAIKQFIESACVGDYKILSDNATHAYKLFEDSFVTAVGAPAAGFGAGCAGNAVCEKWLKRYSADRPHLTGAAAKTPILLVYGGGDTTIPPERMRCALDRLKEDGTNLSVCFETAPGHSTIIDARGEYVADWIANLTLGGPAPSACEKGEAAIDKACASPPPND
jgi:pimeloyl-ACP methyl ester carboxylesterase